MNKVLFLACLMSFLYAYGDNYINNRTGEYYISANDSFYRSSSERGNEVLDRENASEFMGAREKGGVQLSDSVTLNSYTSSADLVAQGASGNVRSSKFYTQETKLVKQLWDDKFELYGGTVLGASPYQLNNIDGAYDYSDRIAAFASGRTGAKYNVSKNFGLLVEGQYNLTGQMADDTDMFTGFNGAQYRGSTQFKTGFEWNF